MSTPPPKPSPGSKAWAIWKKGFDAWEQTTADTLEQWLRSPLVLQPAGALLSMVSRGKRMGERLQTHWVRSLGLATRYDQERSLHALNQIQSRLMDLEEQLADLRERLPR